MTDDRKEPGGEKSEGEKEQNRDVQSPASGDSESLDFVVTEKKTEDREFVGGQRRFSSESGTGRFETKPKGEPGTADRGPGRPGGPENVGGNVSQHLVPTDAELEVEPPNPQPAAVPPKGLPDAKPETPEKQEKPPDDEGDFKPLSQSEVADIEKNMYSNRSYLSDNEREELIGKLQDAAQNTDQPPPPAFANLSPPPVNEPDRPQRVASRRRGGVAHYYKNYIRLQGYHNLEMAREILVGDRSYELQPKRFGSKTSLIVGALLFGLALFALGTQFVADTNDGTGDLVGIVLDNSGRPNIRQVTVTLPELGKSFESDGQGLFHADGLPEGTHRVEYSTAAGLAGSEFATVVAGKTTRITLRPQQSAKKTSNNREISSREPEQRQVTRQKPASRQSDRAAATTTPEPSQQPARERWTTGPASVTLAANVDGAKFAVDGKVLGAGNLTYPDVEPGQHSYTVSRDGYKDISGTLNLAPEENRTLTVKLEPMTRTAKKEAYKEKDYVYSGMAALEANDMQTAISDFTAAIKMQPSNADAYFGRAKAYSLTDEAAQAHDDYVRAAEILHFKKNYGRAITAYNKAIEINDESVTAYLGRANTYLAMKQEIAAITDFENVTRLDRRNFDAYFGLGKARFKQGQYKTASKAFKDARSLDKDNAQVYQYLMLCYFALDDLNEVKKSYEKFEELATADQMSRFRNGSRYAAVRRVLASDN